MAEIIYGLVDPTTPEHIRYVGKTANPKERIYAHLFSEKRSDSCHRLKWLRSLSARNLQPSMVVLEEIQLGESWQEREKYWIAKLKSENHRLTNATCGGDGKPQGLAVRVVPVSERKATSERNRGIPKSLSVRMKISASLKGRKQPPRTIEHRMRLAMALTGKYPSPESRLKMSLSAKARGMSKALQNTWGHRGRSTS